MPGKDLWELLGSILKSGNLPVRFARPINGTWSNYLLPIDSHFRMPRYFHSSPAPGCYQVSLHHHALDDMARSDYALGRVLDVHFLGWSWEDALGNRYRSTAS